MLFRHEIDGSNLQSGNAAMPKVIKIYRCLKDMVERRLSDSSLEVMERGNMESLRLHLEVKCTHKKCTLVYISLHTISNFLLYELCLLWDTIRVWYLNL